MKRKFTAIPGEGIFAGSKVANKRRITAAEEYDGKQFGWKQMIEIREGLEAGLDVSIYADPKYDGMQMEEIRRGLEAEVDVTIYADPKYEWSQMEEIRRGLEAGIDVSIYADPQFDHAQMYWIRQGLLRNLDMRPYAHPDISVKDIRTAVEKPEKSMRSKSKLPKRVQQTIRDAVNSQPNDGEGWYMTMLNNNVIEMAAPDLDGYQYKTLDAVAQAAADEGLDLNNPEELIEAIHDAESFSEAFSHSAHDIEDMLELVKEMRKKYRGTDEPIYMENEYNLNDY